MTATWDDDELEELAELTERGAEAVAELVARYEGSLERMICVRMDKRLCGRVDPADVLQEAYLEAANRLDRYLADPAVPFYVWMRQLTYQVLVNLYRQHCSARMRDVRLETSFDQVPAADSLASAGALAEGLAADWTSPSQAAIRSEATRDLEHALTAMDAIDREILTLRHFEELSNNEVAKILGLQKSAASNRYIRALRRLKQILDRSPGRTVPKPETQSIALPIEPECAP